MAVSTRLDALRTLMDERAYDGVLLRNVSDIRWLTGIARVFDEEVAHTAFITHDGAYLHTDGRYFGAIRQELGEETAWQVDQDDTTHVAWSASRIAASAARVVAVEDTLSLGWYESLEWELSQRSLACLMPRLHADLMSLRAVKDADELLVMRKAQKITDAAFGHMVDFIEVGMSEHVIRAELESYMLSNGADGLSFDSIVASGPNGANPHAKPGERKVRRGDLVVMDYGASLMDYQSDMTRTICIGSAHKLQQSAYDAVRFANEECARVARPSMLGRELHMVAHRILEERGFGRYFTHGLGHGVGIDIHEKPVVGKRGDQPLVEGSVFTIEPGVYLPGEFGIRLEDCGVMTSQGYEPFTESTHEFICLNGE